MNQERLGHFWEQLRSALEATWAEKAKKEDLTEIQFWGIWRTAVHSVQPSQNGPDEGSRKSGNQHDCNELYLGQLARRPNHGTKGGVMPRLRWELCVLTLALLSSAACTVPAARHEEALLPVSTAIDAPDDRRILAGQWDYEDDGIVTLTLDEHGNGTYPWKGGTFITHSLSNHVWRGTWVQKDNDREGGFSLDFSPDFSDGDGRWWYTRIENDRAPARKGGTFHLSKKTSPSASNEQLSTAR